MRQCFLIEFRHYGEWKIAMLLITTQDDIDSRMPYFAERTGFAQEDIRARWIWTTAEAGELQASGTVAYETPGGPIAWLG